MRDSKGLVCFNAPSSACSCSCPRAQKPPLIFAIVQELLKDEQFCLESDLASAATAVMQHLGHM